MPGNAQKLTPVHTDDADEGGHDIDACSDTGVDQGRVAAVAHDLEELGSCTQASMQGGSDT